MKGGMEADTHSHFLLLLGPWLNPPRSQSAGTVLSMETSPQAPSPWD